MDKKKLIDYLPFFKKKSESRIITKEAQRNPAYLGTYRTLFTDSYTGEKNLGEVGPIKVYKIDYMSLRYRSWQAYLESELVQTITKKYEKWVIGRGLKLQYEPIEVILLSSGVKVDLESISQVVESRFNLFKKSKKSDYSGMKNLDMIAKTAFINSVIGGDVLVVLRYENGWVNVQLIDGAHLYSPMGGNELSPNILANGNRLIDGIEMDESGNHIAYHVRQFDNSISIIPARGKNSGVLMAFLVSGLEYRVDNIRGLPLFSVVLETLKKLERYKEATVGSAEERQKIAYFIEHGINSTGENPMIKGLAKAFDADSKNEDIPEDVNGQKLADQVAATTNKMAFNMPNDSTLKQLESKNELYFESFYTVNTNLICATLNIPPEVAMSKYDSNYSASRAALKDWENTLNIERSEFAFKFYQPIFNFWLYMEVLEGRIQLPGYLLAKRKGDDILLEAFQNARFSGAPVPHIDPLKEVNAMRIKLGAMAGNIPLTTVEEAIEDLGGGDARSVIRQFGTEYKFSNENGLSTPNPPPINP